MSKLPLKPQLYEALLCLVIAFVCSDPIPLGSGRRRRRKGRHHPSRAKPSRFPARLTYAATQVDSAFSTSFARGVTIGLAIEADTSHPIVTTKFVDVGQASEVDSALSLSIGVPEPSIFLTGAAGETVALTGKAGETISLKGNAA